MRLFQDFDRLFPELVSNPYPKLSLILNIIDPRCGGVLFFGEKGVGKSLILKLFKKYLRLFKFSFYEIPLNISEENLIGGIDLEKTIEKGIRCFEDGILNKARGSYLLIEEINLLPPEYLSLIFQYSEDITIFGTLNPSEAHLSLHLLDKIGMGAVLDRIEDKEEQLKIIRFWENVFDLNALFVKDYHELNRYISLARAWIENIRWNDSVLDYMVELCFKNSASGHRAELFLFRASRAYAAFIGEREIKEEHVDIVSPLIFLHRSIKVEHAKEEQKEPEEERKDLKGAKEKAKEQHKEHPQNSSFDETRGKDQGGKQDNIDQIPTAPKEKVFEIGETFKTKRFIFKKDRILRHSSGRRIKSKTVQKSGRMIRSRQFTIDRDIDIFGTIKASSPYQRVRGRKEKLIIHKEDFRFKEKERKSSNLVLFVLDGSGSMAAQRRMVATKGAIFSLLLDCYQKRDKVSMILFRRSKAEVILSPTNSLNLAHKKLKDLPAGGNTPLSLGLFEALSLSKRHHLKAPQDRILLILVTDGKANFAINSSEDPLKETQRLCREIQSLPYVDSIVVDTEIKRDIMRMDLSEKISDWLSAKYYPIEELKAQDLNAIVKGYTSI